MGKETLVFYIRPKPVYILLPHPCADWTIGFFENVKVHMSHLVIKPSANSIGLFSFSRLIRVPSGLQYLAETAIILVPALSFEGANIFANEVSHNMCSKYGAARISDIRLNRDILSIPERDGSLKKVDPSQITSN